MMRREFKQWWSTILPILTKHIKEAQCWGKAWSGFTQTMIEIGVEIYKIDVTILPPIPKMLQYPVNY